MSYAADAYVSFPISGTSEPPYLHLRTTRQCHSASFNAIPAVSGVFLLAPANPNRRQLIYVNVSSNFGVIGFGFPPSSGGFSQIAPSVDRKQTNIPEFSLPSPIYTGDIYFLWDDSNAPNGTLMVTEFLD
jgi:hypothetical protein